MITGQTFTEISTPKEVIERVSTISAVKIQPQNINFGDRNGNAGTNTTTPKASISVVNLKKIFQTHNRNRNININKLFQHNTTVTGTAT